MCVPILLVSLQETSYEKAWLELELHLPEDHSTHAVYTREIKKICEHRFVLRDLLLNAILFWYNFKMKYLSFRCQCKECIKLMGPEVKFRMYFLFLQDISDW